MNIIFNQNRFMPVLILEQLIRLTRKGCFMSRARKKPNYDKDFVFQQLMLDIVNCYGDAYDDRDPDDGEHISIREVSEKYKISLLKTRKILITAGVYSTDTSRLIARLRRQGFSVKEIMERTGLSRASVHSYIPYSKGIYNLEDASVDADRKRLQRKREKACKEFVGNLQGMSDAETENALWELLEILQVGVFYTVKGIRFTYRIEGGELFVDGKKEGIAKASVFRAFWKVMDLDGKISGPKEIGEDGEDYLYPIFVRIGVVE